MMNDDQKHQQAGVVRSGRAHGFFPNSLKALSSYLRVVSSGASNVARSAASAASSIVDKDDDATSDQVFIACVCLLLFCFFLIVQLLDVVFEFGVELDEHKLIIWKVVLIF